MNQLDKMNRMMNKMRSTAPVKIVAVDGTEKKAGGENQGAGISNEKDEAILSRESKESYHLKPSFTVVHHRGTDRYIMKLPGGDVPCPGKPKWLETMDQINDILDASPDPRRLRGFMDEIDAAAEKSYNPATLELKPQALKAVVQEIHDGRMLKDLEAIYGMRLADETESTYRSGAFAGSRCSEMHKYVAILAALRAGKRG